MKDFSCQIAITYSRRALPFSPKSGERGQSKAQRRRFCCFRHQQRWMPLENHNKNITKQRTEHDCKHVLKVLEGRGKQKFAGTANFMHWQRQCCSSQEVSRRIPRTPRRTNFATIFAKPLAKSGKILYNEVVSICGRETVPDGLLYLQYTPHRRIL